MNYFSVPSLLGACGRGFETSATSIASNVLALHRGPGSVSDVTPQHFGTSCKGAGSFPASKLCRLAERVLLPLGVRGTAGSAPLPAPGGTAYLHCGRIRAFD